MHNTIDPMQAYTHDFKMEKGYQTLRIFSYSSEDFLVTRDTHKSALNKNALPWNSYYCIIDECAIV